MPLMGNTNRATLCWVTRTNPHPEAIQPSISMLRAHIHTANERSDLIIHIPFKRGAEKILTLTEGCLLVEQRGVNSASSLVQPRAPGCIAQQKSIGTMNDISVGCIARIRSGAGRGQVVWIKYIYKKTRRSSHCSTTTRTARSIRSVEGEGEGEGGNQIAAPRPSDVGITPVDTFFLNRKKEERTSPRVTTRESFFNLLENTPCGAVRCLYRLFILA